MRRTCARCLFFGVMLGVGSCPAQEFVTSGLVAFWTFDEDDIEGDVARDIVGSYDALVYPTATSVPGKIEGALEFDGVSGYVEIPPMGAFPQASVECWALCHDLSRGIQGIVSTWQWADGKVHFKFESYQIQVDKNGGTKIVASAQPETWYHIIYTADTETNELMLYVDGVLVAQGVAGTMPQTMDERRIGSEYDGRYLYGIVDEVRIYNRILTAEEVLQNYAVESNDLPPGVCFEEPAAVQRTVTTPRTRRFEWSEVGAYEIGGGPVPVTLELLTLRAATPPYCAVPTRITVEEVLPAGWTAQNVSAPGAFADGKVVWVLSGADLAVGKILSYDAVAGGEYGVAEFSGSLWESNLAAPNKFSIRGDSVVYPFDDPGIQAEGFITRWLLLGPFYGPPADGTVPTADAMQLDYLTDGGTNTEVACRPKTGDEVQPDFGGAAAGTSLAFTVSRPDVNPDGVPVWLEWYDANDTIVLDDGNGATTDDVYDSVDYVMAYAVTYVENTTGGPLYCFIGVDSDDAIQVLLNGTSVHVNSIARGLSAALTPVDVVPVEVNAGINLVMVKVFEIGGGYGFRFRFQDDAGMPIIDGLKITSGGGVVPPRDQFIRGDANVDGKVNIADAIRVLGHLFGSAGAPSCADAEDANDDGKVNIADAIKILGYLFGQAGDLPPPFGACGIDATADEVGCVQYPPCLQ